MIMKTLICWICFFIPRGVIVAQASSDSLYLLQADRVFDGRDMHEGWEVLVKDNRVQYVGPRRTERAGARIISLTGCTLLPGLIEGHSHLFLHPYNEVEWNDQVLKESAAERVARATVHAKNTLMAGFTTVRDLGTEGAGYHDVGLKQAIEKGIIPGPRMIIATRAIVATGSYGPNNLNYDIDIPKGAAEADGVDALTREVRMQIGKGADLIKLYGDYRWGPRKEPRPTFTTKELELVVELAASSGRQVAVHASTSEGMRRAILAGVSTIEHGDEGNPELFRLMKEKKVALCATLAAGDAILQYRGWKKGRDPEPERIKTKRKVFRQALDAGVTICMGGDVGVFTHGDNAREMELMVDYGMEPIQVLRSATSVNAEVFKIADQAGYLKPGFLADIIAVEGNPLKQISDIRNVRLVMKDGIVYKWDGR
ncbi:MAG TPA: amidohydrolase family protein [Chitinophagaceae bacterium]|nr:amidohydrolase family protein [Chitinophagaceae bacterium]